MLCIDILKDIGAEFGEGRVWQAGEGVAVKSAQDRRRISGKECGQGLESMYGSLGVYWAPAWGQSLSHDKDKHASKEFSDW
jgi:hypothetical protein